MYFVTPDAWYARDTRLERKHGFRRVSVIGVTHGHELRTVIA